MPGITGVGARRLGIQQLLELGQRFWLLAGWLHHWFKFRLRFGDTSRVTENCLIINGHLHKLDQVTFNYSAQDYFAPWVFTDSEDRLQLEFIPFKERLAKTNLLVIYSEVHQMFGYYTGWVETDSGERIEIENLIGFAEEHRARW